MTMSLGQMDPLVAWDHIVGLDQIDPLVSGLWGCRRSFGIKYY